MKFKVGDKIYAKQQYHGLELIEERYDQFPPINNSCYSFLAVPIYMDGVRIEECNTQWYLVDYLEKNYIPVSKLRKQKLEQIKKNI